MNHETPLAIDLYAGLGGWADGLLAEGWRVVGFDIEQHDYGTGVYPGQLVIQDVTTLHGSQFKDASLIVASPPCQAYSYRAMPWKRAKALPPPDNTLFEACFRIQREAIEASTCPTCQGTGVINFLGGNTWYMRSELCSSCSPLRTGCRHIPLIVENVRGAVKWVSQPVKWHFGSYYLWGDVPALMPLTLKHKVPGFRFDGSGGSFQSASVEAQKRNPDGTAHPPGSWFKIADSKNRGARPEGEKGVPHRTAGYWTNPAEHEAVKQHGSGADWFDNGICRESSKSNSRKAASAMIAKIPGPLARHIARVFLPKEMMNVG
jgi:hypothetical protein